MEHQKVLAYKIRKAREIADITQVGMATALGISQQQYSQLEKGETKVTVERLEKIAEILGTTPEKITEFDEKVIFGDMNCTFHEKASNVQYVNQSQTDEVKKVYEARITSLENEITRLHALLEKALTR